MAPGRPGYAAMRLIDAQQMPRDRACELTGHLRAAAFRLDDEQAGAGEAAADGRGAAGADGQARS